MIFFFALLNPLVHEKKKNIYFLSFINFEREWVEKESCKVRQPEYR